ncbi:MAG: hypothetical protein IT565_09700 [Rhodospirillales bacterium]|nr:hypothetical protein [Rhodospirillales bacterium]
MQGGWRIALWVLSFWLAALGAALAEEPPLPRAAPPIPVERGLIADPLVGLWLDSKNGLMMAIEKAAERGRYVMKQVFTDDRLSFAGDIIAEFERRNEAPSMTGRHIWGGKRTGNVRWGEEEGMALRLVGANTLFVQYLDSKYQDGWTYRKVR